VTKVALFVAGLAGVFLAAFLVGRALDEPKRKSTSGAGIPELQLLVEKSRYALSASARQSDRQASDELADAPDGPSARSGAARNSPAARPSVRTPTSRENGRSLGGTGRFGKSYGIRAASSVAPTPTRS